MTSRSHSGKGWADLDTRRRRDVGQGERQAQLTDPGPEFISPRPRQKAMEVAVAQLNASVPAGSDWDPAEVAKVAVRAVRGNERYHRTWVDAFGDPGLLQFEEWVHNQAVRIRRSRQAHAILEATTRTDLEAIDGGTSP